MEAKTSSILSWTVFGFLVILAITLICLILGVVFYANQRIEADTTGACFDGDASTVGVFVGDDHSRCTHYQIPNGQPCTQEASGQCFSNCVVQNGQPTGTCHGENPPTYYTLFPPDCPIPIFLASIQLGIDFGDLFYLRDSILGKCRTYVQYALGDMTPSMGHDSEAYFFPNNLIRLNYDPDLSNLCLSLVSETDPQKQCLKAAVYWMYSTVTDSDFYLCEYTYACASHRTFENTDDTTEQIVAFRKQHSSKSAKANPVPVVQKKPGVKNIHKIKPTSVRPSQKRLLSKNSLLVPNASKVSTFFYPRAQIRNQLAGNVTAVQEWWSQAPPAPANRTWPKVPKNSRPSHKRAAETTLQGPPIGSPQWCILSFLEDELGVVLSDLNQTMYDAFNEGYANVPIIMGGYYYGGSFDGTQPDELFYFYSLLMFEFQIDDLC